MPVDLSAAPLLVARQQLATAIADATGYTCWASFRPTFEPPCYLLEGAGLQPGTGGTLNYKVKVTAAYASQEGDHLDAAEELARLGLDAVAAANLAVVFPVPGPSLYELNLGNDIVVTFVGVQFEALMNVNIREA